MFTKQLTTVLGVGIFALLLTGGSVYAIQSLTKVEEVQLKQEMKPQVSEEEKAVNKIGIFPPGFEDMAAQALPDYEKAHGIGNVQVVEYEGYTLVVPPNQLRNLNDIKAKVDESVAATARHIPSAEQQTVDITAIRKMFGTGGGITFDAIIGVYTDESGFQYNFLNGELVNKQVGITTALKERFERAYPHLSRESSASPVLTNEQARERAFRVVKKEYENVSIEEVGTLRTGVVFGANEVRVLVDKVTGDIIHYSKVK